MDRGHCKVAGLVIDRKLWSGRRVFLTGHTGFKGAWMCLLLRKLGAQVVGFALPPSDDRGIFVAADVAREVDHEIGDIRDLDHLSASMARAQPDVVLHFAAQALVLASYADPVETYATNVLGTVHVLEAVRRCPSVRAVVVVTSDKCYENVGSLQGYRETDRLGGYDPYSNSKGCAELVTSSYRRSFFQQPGSASIASARAGNVIGGGDWAAHRLVPDAVRSFIAGDILSIRHPAAIRPWQHVLDPLIGYLSLAQHLLNEGAAFAEEWNFGPAPSNEVPVGQIADGVARLWGEGARWEHKAGENLHEAAYLKLDCSKAHQRLHWRPLIGLDKALQYSVDWYRAQDANADLRSVSELQIEQTLSTAV